MRKWLVSALSNVTNRYGFFCRFHELMVSDSEGDKIMISAWWSTGARAVSISLSRDDAQQLLEALSERLH